MSEQNQSRSLEPSLVLPLPGEPLQEAAARLVRFDIADWLSLIDGNRDTLPLDDPVYYLLNLRARTELQKERPTDREKERIVSYQEGVMVGAIAVRSHIETLRATGRAMPEAAFDPQNGPQYQNSELQGVLGLGKVAQWALRRPLRIYDAATRTSAYFQGEGAARTSSALALLSILNATRQQENAARSKKESRILADYMTKGVGDAFMIYAQLYGHQAISPQLTLTLGSSEYECTNPKPFLASLRPRARQKYDARRTFLQPPDIAHIDAIMDGTQQTLQYQSVGSLRTFGGAASIAPFVTAESTKAAADRTITSLQSVWIGNRLVDPVRSNEYQEVRMKGPEYALGKKDALIVTGADDKLFTLHYPFKVPRAITRDEAVELEALCRSGTMIVLKEQAPEATEKLWQYAAPALNRQHQDGESVTTKARLAAEAGTLQGMVRMGIMLEVLGASMTGPNVMRHIGETLLLAGAGLIVLPVKLRQLHRSRYSEDTALQP